MTNLSTQLTRSHFAAVRAWLQGRSVRGIQGHWCLRIAGEPENGRLTLARLREACVHIAWRRRRQDLAEHIGAPLVSPVLRSQAVMALRHLEVLARRQPQPEDGVHLWLAAPFARRLEVVGVRTLGDLVVLYQRCGRDWVLSVPGVSPRAGACLTAQLAGLGAQVPKGETLPLSAFLPMLAFPAAAQLPRQLGGRTGANRAASGYCVIDAKDDYEAIQCWLSLWPQYSKTHRSYRKEAIRFLAWMILERGRPFSDANLDDCIAYRAFLANPQPVARWCGARAPQAKTIANMTVPNPDWRPFVGPLCERSRGYSEAVLKSLCAWLVGRQYLRTNPWDGLSSARSYASANQVEKAIPSEIWQAMSSWLAEQAQQHERGRLWRAAVLLLRETGMRCDEAAQAKAERLQQLPDAGPLSQLQAVWGELRVTGKGGKTRHVPVSRRLWEALCAHWGDRGVGQLHAGPLLAPLKLVGGAARARARVERSQCGYSSRGLYGLIAEAARAFRRHLDESQSGIRFGVYRIHPHAFRHTFGTHALAAGMGIEVVRGYLGHASLATTTLYTTAERDRRLQDVDKLYRLAV